MSHCAVLIVEDEAFVLRFMRDTVEAEPGLHVACAAATVADALSALRREAPDIAIVDGILPDGASFTLVKAIRSASPGAYIIGMSASPTDETAARFVESGADIVLDKRDIPSILSAMRRARRTHCPDDKATLKSGN